MGKALKKNEDYTQLNRLKWAAWGVINIEELERMQRRNYINAVREELKLYGVKLECGGGPGKQFYRAFKPIPHGTPNPIVTNLKSEWVEVTGFGERGQQAFQSVCLRVLRRIDPDHANMEGV